MRLIYFLLFMIVSANLSAQYPDCNDLSVENMSFDSSGNLLVVINNSCLSCAYGLDGCLYSEMNLMRTVSPFDTLAATNCWCLGWDDPNIQSGVQTFSLQALTSGLPPITDLKLVMIGCGCIEIPFSSTLSNEKVVIDASYSIFPNPVDNFLTVSDIDHINHRFEIRDFTGKILLSQKRNSNILDLTSLNSGFYILTVFNNTNQPLESKKFVKK